MKRRFLVPGAMLFAANRHNGTKDCVKHFCGVAWCSKYGWHKLYQPTLATIDWSIVYASDFDMATIPVCFTKALNVYVYR